MKNCITVCLLLLFPLFALCDDSTPSVLSKLDLGGLPPSERPTNTPPGLVSIVRPRGNSEYSQVPLGHVMNVIYSKDGKRLLLITLGPDQVRLLDPETFIDVLPPLAKRLMHGELSSDGKRILGEGLLRWDMDRLTDTGWQFHGLPLGRKVWSPDCKTAAMVSYESGKNKLELWDMSQDVPLIKNQIPSNNSIRSLAWSPDGSRLVSGHDDGIIRFWDVTHTLASPLFVFDTKERGAIDQLIFLGNGETLLSVRWQDNRIKHWKVTPTGLTFQDATKESPHKSPVTVCLSPDQTTMAVGRLGKVIELYQIKVSEMVHMGILQDGFLGYVSNVAISPNGKTLIASDSCNSLSVWDISVNAPVLRRRLSGSESVLLPLKFSSDGSTLLLKENTWGVAARWEKSKLTVGPERLDRGSDFAISADGKMLAASYESWEDIETQGRFDSISTRKRFVFNCLRLYEWAGNHFQRHSAFGGTLVAGSVFHPSGQQLVEFRWFYGGNQLWNLEQHPPTSQKLLPSELPEGFCRSTICGTFSPNNSLLATLDLKGLNQQKRITLWKTTNWKRLMQWDASSTLIDIILSPNGDLVAGTCYDGSVLLYETDTGKQSNALPKDTQAINVVWSNQGKELITLDKEGIVKKWDTKSLKEIYRWRVPTYTIRRLDSAPPRKDAVISRNEYPLLLAPDGQHVAVSNIDGSVYLFRIGQ